jgi:hypothetical protein
MDDRQCGNITKLEKIKIKIGITGDMIKLQMGN